MKIKRYKKVNRHLQFYINNFNFRQPYQLLLDGTFCYAALNNQINIADNIPRYLQGELKLLTTQCAILEMEGLGPKLNGALSILKQYSLHKCGHEKQPVSGSKCFLSMVGEKNTKHYIIATQDRDLQAQLRRVPSVPLLYLHLKTPVLDPPSQVSLQASKDQYNDIFNQEQQRMNDLKKANGLLEDVVKPKRKKIKGPNPLSCKKKKKKGVTQNNTIVKKAESDSEKKKRKKIRIPKHVKEEMLRAN